MIVDPRMAPRMRAPPVASASRYGMVWRHVSVIGERHWLSATARACRTGEREHSKQSDREDFHHGYLFFHSILPSVSRNGDEHCRPNICVKASRRSRDLVR